MVFEMSQIVRYLKMLTNIVVCYTFLSILQIGISPWPALQTTTFKSLQNIARNNRLTEQPETLEEWSHHIIYELP